MAQLMPLPLTVSCSSKIQIGFTFRVPAYPGCPKKEAVKWLYNVLLFCWQVISGVTGSAVGAILRWIETLSQWRMQDFCKGGAAAGAFGMPQSPSCPLSLRPLRKFHGSQLQGKNW